MEEVRNCFLIPTLEDDINDPFVVFRVGEFGRYLGVLGIEVAEANFQRKKEKSFSIRKSGVALEQHGTQFVCYRCQGAGTLFPPS